MFKKCMCFFQKNPCVRKIRVRNPGAGNGCANFMDAWKNALFLQEKAMSIKFLVLGRGRVFWVLGGGGVPILFLWARGFFCFSLSPNKVPWETDFYTPPVLGGAALFDNSAPAVYKNPVPKGA